MKDDNLMVRRIRIDLKDFDLRHLPEMDSEQPIPWVAVGKHMCGCSTDYAMIACQNALRSPMQPNQSLMWVSRLKASGCRGLFIATCCHHRCEWESYSAKSQFLELGCTPIDFEIISWMTGQPTLIPCT